MSRQRKRAREAGFGMVELLAAMVILSVGILALFAMLDAGMVHIRRAAVTATTTALADSEMEKFRAGKFNVIGLDDAAVGAADGTYKADTAYRTDGPATTLTSAPLSTDTTLTVESASAFPTQPPFRIKVSNSEVMLVTAMSGDGKKTWTVTRGIDGTTAVAHLLLAEVKQKQRAHVVECGTGVCTNADPTSTVAGADGKNYRLDTYVTWQLTSNSSGTAGRNAKLVTLVVRDVDNPGKAYARVSSTFDESTGR